MLHLTKKRKLELIQEMIEVLDVKAYEIAKNTTLTEAGIGKILNGKVKNPQERSLNEMYNYLDNLINKEKNDVHQLNEEKEEYNLTINQEKLIKCLEEQSKLVKEISRLQILLEKNNIEYE